MGITLENAKALGVEIKRAREAKGIPSVRELSRQTGIGYQHLVQIESAYVQPNRGFTVPSDSVLDTLAVALSVPVSRFHALLGRLPDAPFPAFEHAETYQLAEEIDRLSLLGRRIVKEAIRGARSIAIELEQNPAMLMPGSAKEKANIDGTR